MTCGEAVGVSICWRGCSASTDRCSQTSPWAGCLACQPASLAAWLPSWLAHFPTTVFGLLIVLDEFPHFGLFHTGITHCVSK